MRGIGEPEAILLTRESPVAGPTQQAGRTPVVKIGERRQAHPHTQTVPDRQGCRRAGPAGRNETDGGDPDGKGLVLDTVDNLVPRTHLMRPLEAACGPSKPHDPKPYAAPRSRLPTRWVVKGTWSENGRSPPGREL